ncbi:hypothetical protein B9Z55_017258 [Caenorhabditis nigoni]|uniref:G-protein coupled receptors family 1 profile domain-containing protein n=2 Tax=Caenorhabditis nigoni TaxID=1611254 RepID=A0A2G5T8V0_9PELO|nr:hypothetical protein B9Z55_017258 [Caenorhabditis nigoni]
MTQNFTLSDFDQFDNSTKEALVIFGNDVLLLSQYFDKLNFVLESFGVFINLFHIVILSRKSLISNVINVILLGIAISDIVNLSVLIKQFLVSIFATFQDECALPKSSFLTMLDFYLLIVKDDFRRLSTWLGVLMASLRYLTIRNSLNPNFNFLSKPSSGWKTLAVAFLISTLMSLFYLVRVDLISAHREYPESCGYPVNFSTPIYSYKRNELFFSAKEIYKGYIVFDGILKIIPAIVLPILALLLLRELKKAEVSRKKSSVVSRIADHTDSTSKLVIIMTITCIFAEAPMGISFVVEGLVADVPKLRKIVTSFESLLFTFATLNATTHFFVCLGVSTPYRKAVKGLLGYKGSRKPITISPKISSASIVTLRQVDARIDG